MNQFAYLEAPPRPAVRPSTKLNARLVDKPWGRHLIPSFLGSTGGRRVGEVWFEHEEMRELPLLVKYIFTSENLSVQVHPDDVQARSRGLTRGKTECWYILDAEPGARIGLGLREALPADKLREAALDGSLGSWVDWKPVTRGDFFFVPAGTVHAIGAGITLLELQQNADVTYRLYDYGRPRELHLDDAVAVSNLSPYPESLCRRAGGTTDTVLVDGPFFSLVRATATAAIPESFSARLRWVIPLDGDAFSAGQVASPGECLLLEPGEPLALADGATVLVGVEGSVSAPIATKVT